MQHLSESMQFLGFLFPTQYRSPKLGELKKIMRLLISYFLSKICAKIYQIRFIFVKVITRQNSDIFETQCIIIVCVLRENGHFKYLIYMLGPFRLTCDIMQRYCRLGTCPCGPVCKTLGRHVQ